MPELVGSLMQDDGEIDWDGDADGLEESMGRLEASGRGTGGKVE